MFKVARKSFTAYARAFKTFHNVRPFNNWFEYWLENPERERHCCIFWVLWVQNQNRNKYVITRVGSYYLGSNHNIYEATQTSARIFSNKFRVITKIETNRYDTMSSINIILYRSTNVRSALYSLSVKITFNNRFVKTFFRFQISRMICNRLILQYAKQIWFYNKTILKFNK